MGSSRGRGPGQGSRSGEGSRFWVKVGVKVVVKVGGQSQGSKSWGQGKGHDRWSQGLGQGWGSMSGVKVRGVVKVMGRGSMSGGLGSDGGWGGGWR